MKIYCCGCGAEVDARLTNGKEIYPHRYDLQKLPFWRCDSCSNYVGCHHKTSTPTKPLGHIPTDELRKARLHIHALVDPLWQSGKMSRDEVYKKISEKLGYVYHTANLKTLEEAREVWKVVRSVYQENS